MNRKKVSIFGIIIFIWYLASTFLLIITGSSISLFSMELATMMAGILMVLLILVLPFSHKFNNELHKKFAVICSSACMILTNIAHLVNLSVTQPLIKDGVKVPDYLQIGKWPSVEMAIDYLGWGLFMGLAFIFVSFAVKAIAKIKPILFISGLLCLVGFLGAILINHNLWYIAPLGYGLGTFILCIKLLTISPNTNNHENSD